MFRCLDAGALWIRSAWMVLKLPCIACAQIVLAQCPPCTCPDKELADPHRCNCTYRTAAAVMADLDEARDEFLDDDDHVKRGHCQDVSDAERRIKHKLVPRNVWILIPFFELFTSCPKDEPVVLVFIQYIQDVYCTYITYPCLAGTWGCLAQVHCAGYPVPLAPSVSPRATHQAC